MQVWGVLNFDFENKVPVWTGKPKTHGQDNCKYTKKGQRGCMVVAGLVKLKVKRFGGLLSTEFAGHKK